MKTLFVYCLLFVFPTFAQAQATDTISLPYYEMPPAPDDYRPGNVLARMIDGLGYRFYWATKGLRPEDLAYRPAKGARSTSETIDHIVSLSKVIANATEGVPNGSSPPDGELPWEEKRAKILRQLLKTSQRLANQDEEALSALRITFSSKNGTSEMPYWNVINGPLADAIYHTGQIASFRRTSGNPMNPKVDVLRGKNRP